MQGKVVVITGASAGVGRATAVAFAKLGACIGLFAREHERLKDTQEEIRKLGAKVFIFSGDVAKPEDIETFAKQVEKELGPIDIWVNNAMVSVFSPAKEMTSDEYQRVTDVTYLGYVYGTLTALKYMIPRDRGIIIQVGSALSYRSIPLQSAYCAGKHAVKGFTDSLRCELMHDKSQIKISMIQLPALNTPQFNWVKSRLSRKPCPVPPIFQPEVAANAIVWAANHYRREWHVGFKASLSILINKFSPHLGDWYLAKKGYDSQQYDGLDKPDRTYNLFEPVLGNFKAHGDFDHQSSPKSIQLWLSQHRKSLLIAGITIVIVYGLIYFLQRHYHIFG